jgi:hypothetical protein
MCATMPMAFASPETSNAGPHRRLSRLVHMPPSQDMIRRPRPIADPLRAPARMRRTRRGVQYFFTPTAEPNRASLH